MKKILFVFTLILQSLTFAQMLNWEKVLPIGALTNLGYAKSTNTLYGIISNTSKLVRYNLETKTISQDTIPAKEKFSLINDTTFLALKLGILSLSEDGGYNWKKISNLEIKDFFIDKNRILISTKDNKIGLIQNMSEPFYYTYEFPDEILGLASLDSIIMVKTKSNLYRSVDSGSSWNIISSIGSTSEGSILLSKDTTFYIKTFSQFFYSSDLGLTWKCIDVGLFSYNLLLDASSTIYLSYDESTKKSTNHGEQWLQFAPYKANSLAFTDSLIFLTTATSNYVYDPAKKIDPGSNYMPLAIGNKFRYVSSFTSDYGTSYSLVDNSIDSSKNFNGKIYYALGNTFYRYDDSLKILYTLSSGGENTYIDFKAAPGTAFPGGTLIRKSTNLFGLSRQLVGLGKISYGYEESLYAEGLGLAKSSSTSTGMGGPKTRDNQLIEALIADSSGNMIHYTRGYKPSISSQLMKILDPHTFKYPVTVNHAWNRLDYTFGQYKEGINFINKVWLKMYYGKGSDITPIDSVSMTISNNFVYTFNITADTSLLNNGYKLYYKIFAEDKQFIPAINYMPGEGYYEAQYEKPISGMSFENEIPYNLMQNFPNPFNPKTEIRYSVKEGGNVKLIIYDLLGNVVANLVDEYKASGNYSVEFNGISLASGIYFYKLEINDFTSIKKLTILK